MLATMVYAASAKPLQKSRDELTVASAPAPVQSTPTRPKGGALDVRGADAKEVVDQLKDTLNNAKRFLKSITDRLSDDSINTAKIALEEIDAILAKGSSIDDNEKSVLKQKRDELNALILATRSIKKFLEDRGLAELNKSIDDGLAKISKIDLGALKIAIISSEYGDLTSKIGSISRTKRFCDIKDHAIKECQNRAYCTLTASSLCTDRI